MRANEFLAEVKQRLDAKCWKGKHKEGTKIKGGVRVNNCVPNESVDEAANAAQQAAIAIAKKKKAGINEELDQEFDMIETMVEHIAAKNNVDSEVVWEDLESLTDDELYVFAVTQEPVNEDWQKVNKKDKTDGMSKKAVSAYRREHPGSKLKTAVTTKPSKLKKGSKASKRRKSYCSRSRGQMKMHNISCAKTPDKAICKARRRWNCESQEQFDAMLREAVENNNLQPGQYYIWEVFFDDGTSKRIKVTKDNFDPKAYYDKQNKNVINVEYNWTVHN